VDRRGALAVTLLAAVLWGTSFPANDLGLRDADPWTFLAARFAIAFAAAALAARLLGALDAGLLRNKWVWATALANSAGYQLQFVGQELTTPGTASLMVNAGNLAVPLFAFLVHGERPTGTKAPALALAAAGVLLVGTRGDLASVSAAHLAGTLLTLAAGLGWALVIVFNKSAVGSGKVLGVTTWVVGLTALLGVPGALLLGHGELGPQGLAAAAYTGLVCTTLAFFLWSAGLRVLTSVVSGIALLLEIVVAFALSAALGLEALGAASLAGAACILAAIALASRAPAAEPLPTPKLGDGTRL
jgi:O-acetylserine/cysteine efflux transporter